MATKKTRRNICSTFYRFANVAPLWARGVCCQALRGFRSLLPLKLDLIEYAGYQNFGFHAVFLQPVNFIVADLAGGIKGQQDVVWIIRVAHPGAGKGLGGRADQGGAARDGEFEFFVGLQGQLHAARSGDIHAGCLYFLGIPVANELLFEGQFFFAGRKQQGGADKARKQAEK